MTLGSAPTVTVPNLVTGQNCPEMLRLSRDRPQDVGGYWRVQTTFPDFETVTVKTMAGQKHRTQILLEPEQHSALVEISRQEERSISDLVRRIISQYLKERARDTERQRAIQSLEKLTVLRRKIEQRSGIHQGDLIAETRAERDEQMGRVWSGGEG